MHQVLLYFDIGVPVLIYDYDYVDVCVVQDPVKDEGHFHFHNVEFHVLP